MISLNLIAIPSIGSDGFSLRYCEAALGRFVRAPQETAKPAGDPASPSNYYRLPRPGILWNGAADAPLPRDGGRTRRRERSAAAPPKIHP